MLFRQGRSICSTDDPSCINHDPYRSYPVHPQSDRQPPGNPHPNHYAYILVPLLQAWQPPRFIGGTYEYQRQWPQEEVELAELSLTWYRQFASQENTEQQQVQMSLPVSALHQSAEVIEQSRAGIAQPGEVNRSTASVGNILHIISPERPKIPMSRASNQSADQSMEASLAAHRRHRRNPSETYSKHSVEPEPHFYLDDEDYDEEDDEPYHVA